MTAKSLLLFACFSLLSAAIVAQFLGFERKLQVLFEWNVVNIDGLTDDSYKLNTILHDVDLRKHENGQITYLVTAIGEAPMSLLEVTDKENENGKLLKPYPNDKWSQLEKYGCNNTIVSAYRILVDRCNRVWVVDSGVRGIRGDNKLCPAKLLVFDKNNDVVINQEFPSDMFTIRSGVKEQRPINIPANIVLQYNNAKCQDLRKEGADSITAIIADPKSNSLIWWKNGVFKRLITKEFYPEKNALVNSVLGLSYQLNNGVLPLAIGQGMHSNKLYLAPMASYNMINLDLRFLDCESASCKREYKSLVSSITKLPGSVNSHKAVMVSAADLIFFVELENQTLVSWDPRKPFTPDNLVYHDHNTEFNVVSGIKINRRPWDGPLGPILPTSIIYGCTDLIMISNTYQKIANNLFDPKETNFRIFRKPCIAREPMN